MTEPCKLKYSLTQGVFVVMHGDEPAAICESHDLLWQWLGDCTEKHVSQVRIFLMDYDDKDEVTHLVFEEKRGDFETYEAWAEWHGPSIFMRHWFDESTDPKFDQDFARRYRRWKEINVPPKREVITLIRSPEPVYSSIAAE